MAGLTIGLAIDEETQENLIAFGVNGKEILISVEHALTIYMHLGNILEMLGVFEDEEEEEPDVRTIN